MLLSFSAKNLPIEILERTLIGRKEIVDQVENELIEKVTNNQTYQSLLIAPRGSGKTHITRVLYDRIQANSAISDKILVAYMNEDERGIANFSDFIRYVLVALVRYKEAPEESIQERILEISSEPSNRQENSFIDLLSDVLGERILIILIENLDVIFDGKKGIGNQGQRKLRSFLHENNNICLLATSQNLFLKVQESGAPFYNFFNIRQLEKLNLKQSFEFIKVLVDLEQENDPNSDLSKRLRKETEEKSFFGKVKAIYQLTGGNHRLLVIFFDFLKAEVKSDLFKVFEKAMNDLKPYYEQFLDDLSPQQQKIIKFLCSEHKPKMGKEIARFCFIEKNTLSKIISILVTKKKLLDKHSVGRDTYYELKEPLMRICFELTEHPSGIFKLFVNFLSLLYSKEMLELKYLKLKSDALLNKTGEVFKESEIELHGSAISEDRRKNLDELLKQCKTDDDLTRLIEKSASKTLPQKASLDDQIEKDFKLVDDLLDLLKKLEILTSGEKRLLQQKANNDSNRVLIQLSKTLKKIENNVKKDPKTRKAKLKDLSIDELLNMSVFGSADDYDGLAIVLYNLNRFEDSFIAEGKAIELDPKNDKYINGISAILWNLKRYEEAVAKAKEAIKIAPKDPIYHRNLGLILWKLDRKEMAIKSLKKAIKLDSNYIGAYEPLSFYLYGAKRFKETINILGKALKIDPSNPTFYTRLGYSFQNIDNHRKAVIAFSNSLKIDKNDHYTQLGIGFSYMILGKYQESIQAYERALKREGDNAYIYYYLGYNYYQLKEYLKANKYFDNAVRLKVNNGMFNYWLASSYKELKKYDKAEYHFIKAIEIDPSKSYYHCELGETLYEVEEYERAIKAFKTAIKFDQQYDYAINELGRCFMKLKKYKDATQEFKNAIEIDSTFAPYYDNLINSLFQSKDYDDCLKILNRASEIFPKNTEFYYKTGLLEELIFKEPQKALESVGKAVTLDPKNEDLTEMVGRLLIKLEQWIQAEEVLKIAMKTFPKAIFPYLLLVKISESKREYDKAIWQLRGAIEKFPKVPDLYESAARILKSKKRYDQAIDLLRMGISKLPKESMLHNILGLLFIETGKFSESQEEFSKGLKKDSRNWYLNGSLLQSYLSSGDIKKAINQFRIVWDLTNPEKHSIQAFLVEDNLYPILKFTNIDEVGHYLDFLMKFLTEQDSLFELWKALPEAIFELLIRVEEYSKNRLDDVFKFLEEYFVNHEEATIPLLYLNIGIQYLMKNKKQAIYDLSKEERDIFERYVLEKRKSL